MAVRKILSKEMTLKQRHKCSEGEIYTNIRQKHLDVQKMAGQSMQNVQGTLPTIHLLGQNLG